MAEKKIVNAFTVDWEDWFHGIELNFDRWEDCEDRIEIGTRRLLSLLEHSGCYATFFVLGCAAERAPHLLRDIRAAGHEIGIHGYSHRFVYNLGKEEFRSDLRRSKNVIENILGEECGVGHRAPFFCINKDTGWAFEVVRDEGFLYDSSVFPIHNYRYGIPNSPRWPYSNRSELIEFPLTTWRCFGTNVPASGGAYFRIFPYNFTRFMLSRINAVGKPFVFYIHPWELDPSHPSLDLPYRVRLTHYHNLDRTEARLRTLLRDFSFAPMINVLNSEGYL